MKDRRLSAELSHRHMIFEYATYNHIGRINLVDIRADLHTFGLDYPSSGQSPDFLRERIVNSEVIIALNAKGELCAFIVFEVMMTLGFCYIHQVSVAPEYQRQGIAYNLLARAEKAANEKECISMGLLTTANAPWGINLYEKFGFEQKELDDLSEQIKYVVYQNMGNGPYEKIYFEKGISNDR